MQVVVVRRNGMKYQLNIQKYSDEWFIVIMSYINKSAGRNFKCDSLEGVEQFLMNSKDYFKYFW